MANLRRLSVPDLQALRGIILTVLDEGDTDGKQWEFYAEDEALANNERLDFCNAIQQRIFVTEPLLQRKGSTDATQQDSDSTGKESY